MSTSRPADIVVAEAKSAENVSTSSSLFSKPQFQKQKVTLVVIIVISLSFREK